MSKPVLYYCPQTRAETAMWMNAELGDVCDVKIVDIRAGAHKKPDYLAANPMGKVPALTHNGVAVTESAAICAYLADIFPDKGLAPAIEDPRRGAYYRWMFFAPSVVEPMMLDKLGGVKRENPVSAGHGREEDVLGTLKGALSKTPFLLGDKPTAADVVMASTLHFAMMFGAVAKEEPFVSYAARMTARPAFVRAQETSAKYAKELGY
jgi:glutathione S-transferase